MQNNGSSFDWKQTFFRNWNFMRAVRLFFGIVILIEAFNTHETFYGIAGGLFLVQAVFNWGCCGTVACSTPMRKNKPSETIEDIQFEEIKTEK